MALRCEKCNVTVTTPTEVCPLCGAPLAGEPEGCKSWFAEPERIPRWRHISAWGIYLVGWLCLTALFVGVNLVLTPDVPWSATASLSLFTAFVLVRYFVKDRAHLASKIFSMTLLTVAIIISVQALTPKSVWAYTYAIPILLTIAAIVLGTLAASGRNGAAAHGMYMLAVATFGLIPAGINSLYNERVILPSIICATVCATVIIMILTTHFRAIMSELGRRFHL